MTRRGRLVLLFGFAVYLVAWAFGSKALYPLGVGLVVVALAAWLWMRLARLPVRLIHSGRSRDHFEGDDVSVRVEVELTRGGVPPAAVVLNERISKLGDRITRLEGSGARRSGDYLLASLPRGRYELQEVSAVLEDPFGLARAQVELDASSTILVYPRLVELDRLFSGTGASLPEGRRLLMRQTSGFDLHSVRDYQQGESLRRVHWRSTAKRSRLMVKELEDAPRDEVAVLLDARAGTLPATFDLQVRAAGSILFAHASRNRRAVLVVNGERQESVQTTSSEGDRRRALELLAAAEPDGSRAAEALLVDEGGPVLGALELVVVTATLTGGLVDRLVGRRMGHRHVSLVYADGAELPQPGLLQLQASGVPVAVVREGDDLVAVLGGRPLAEAAHG
jgi:uncharacterized protein (DUF58 family)